MEIRASRTEACFTGLRRNAGAAQLAAVGLLPFTPGTSKGEPGGGVLALWESWPEWGREAQLAVCLKRQWPD